MRVQCLLFSCALLATVSQAQQQPDLELDWGEVADAAQQWAEANLDPDALQALPELDRKQVEDFLKAFESHLKGSNVLDLARFQDAAKLALPLLDHYEETAPLAVWLRTRLDYFEVAEEFEKSQSPVPDRPLTNPPPARTRTVWVNKLSDTNWPETARELVPRLKPIFAMERVPPELVWLAEVESTFNPKARSPVGAAGLFQLMPATAKRFGLRAWPWDQRYQPESSARAAAKYLYLLGKQFGDWRLALAAYNAGEGRVQRLLNEHQAESFDAIATRLPAETQLFVPKVEATVLRREGREIPKYAGGRGTGK